MQPLNRPRPVLKFSLTLPLVPLLIAWVKSVRDAAAKRLVIKRIILGSLLAMGGASAAPVNWTIYDAVFTDGGTLTGTFTYDYYNGSRGTYSTWNLASTDGTNTGSALTAVSGDGSTLNANNSASQLIVYKGTSYFAIYNTANGSFQSGRARLLNTGSGSPPTIQYYANGATAQTRTRTLSSGYACVDPCLPAVTNLSRSSGPPAGGTSVVITGSNFFGATGAGAVKFGQNNATSYTVDSAVQITAVAPAGSGTVDITVTTVTGATVIGTSSTSASTQFTYIVPLPTVASVSPSSGSVAGGTSVVISGTNFTGATAVKFGAANAASYTVNSATQITATAPAGAVGTVDITVTTPDGTSSTSASDRFTYVATVPGAPTVGTATGGDAQASVTFTAPGSNGGSAITGYTVTSNPGGLTGTGASSPITISGLTNGTSYTFTVTATNSVGTGAASGASNSVTPAPPSVAGVCGSAAGQRFAYVPAANLCATGTASVVSSANGQYTWSCSGSGGGASASCAANWATISGTNTGMVAVPSSNNNNWVLDTSSVGFVAARGANNSPATPPPVNYTFPQGLTSFTLNSGTQGSSASVTINYTEAIPAGAVYMKYGKTSSSPTTDIWYQLPANRVSFANDRKSVTLTLTDGGIGDHDLTANSVISDPGGPATIADESIPTLSEWAMIFMASLMVMFGYLRLHNRRA